MKPNYGKGFDLRWITLVMFSMFMSWMISSCTKETETTDREMKVWLHRVNTVSKAQHFQFSYSGFELDVHFDMSAGTFIVKHDAADTTTLTLEIWLSSITDPSRLGYWLDFKNLDSLNKGKALTEMLRIRQEFALTKETIVVESSSPVNLAGFSQLNFRTSYYIPFFYPDSITAEQETYYREEIGENINESGIQTISAYSLQHEFMKRWFTPMNKLLWYIDSYDPAVKDSVIAAIRKDPTVEILLVTENF
jgi:hypothetical protein